jgi:hypothetical protein
MERVIEFQNIMPIANIQSVLQHGVLSHRLADQLNHEDISLSEIQERRDQKAVPNGFPLHHYANVYFHARNPMMSLRQGEAHNLCILRISTDILSLPDVVVTDQNAASDYVRFLVPEQMGHYLDLNKIYARDWRDDHLPTYWRQKSAKCAEVLVPDRIDINYIVGVYVVNELSASSLRDLGCNLPIAINADLFFR